jgi:hypothetical protein
MSIYIVPFNYPDAYQIHELSNSNYHICIYRSPHGPLGFGVNEQSINLSYPIIVGGIYVDFNPYKTSLIDIGGGWCGFIFLEPKDISEEIEKANQAVLIAHKNKLRERYNKETTAVPYSILLHSFVDGKYKKEQCDILMKNKNVLLGYHDDMGVGYIFDNFSGNIFLRRLKEQAEIQGIDIIFCKSINEVPYF